MWIADWWKTDASPWQSSLAVELNKLKKKIQKTLHMLIFWHFTEKKIQTQNDKTPSAVFEIVNYHLFISHFFTLFSMTSVLFKCFFNSLSSFLITAILKTFRRNRRNKGIRGSYILSSFSLRKRQDLKHGQRTNNQNHIWARRKGSNWNRETDMTRRTRRRKQRERRGQKWEECRYSSVQVRVWHGRVCKCSGVYSV